MTLVSASVIYRRNIRDFLWLVPYAGIGVAKTHFKLKVPYGGVINKDSQGYNYTLDFVTAEGGGTGYPVTLGAEIWPMAARVGRMSGIELDVSAGYMIAQRVNTQVEGVGATIVLRSFMLGGKLILHI